jgi:CrcB protein
MWMFAYIALGGAIGAVSRYGAGLMIAAIFGTGFQPVATLVVNVAGSGVMGLCYAMIDLGFAISDHMRGFIMVGFLGALTTFSAFSLDAVKLIEKGDVAVGVAYIFGSVILSLAAFLLVLMVARGFLPGQ